LLKTSTKTSFFAKVVNFSRDTPRKSGFAALVAIRQEAKKQAYDGKSPQVILKTRASLIQPSPPALTPTNKKPTGFDGEFFWIHVLISNDC
jgi:hypothetical protein